MRESRTNPRIDGQELAFRGWWMVLWCTIARGMSAPGQTIGVSAFIDSMIDDLGLTRSTISTTYLIGTLTGAVALPRIGRWIDRVGVRQSMATVALAFGCAIAFTGAVQNVVMLGVAFIGLRMLGQGALTLTGSTGVTLWFDRRRGRALAFNSMGSIAMLSLAPLIFAAVINTVGWRWAWVVLGVAVVVIVIPIALFAIIDRPSDVGQVPDGRPVDEGDTDHAVKSRTVAEAMRTPAFWALTSLTALMSGLITGLTFHNTDVLGARGLSEEQAAVIFIPQMVGGIAGGFVIGWLTDRVAPRPLLLFSGLALTGGITMALFATPGPMALTYGLVTGVALGSVSALGAALYPKWFGTDHIGSIRGTATSVGVAASAAGPLLLAVGNDVSGSYQPVVVAGATVTLVVTLVSVFTPSP
ncbi:MAG: MFS transporter [Acidimicrobiales bacterium]